MRLESVLALTILAGCAHGPSAEERAAEHGRLLHQATAVAEAQHWTDITVLTPRVSDGRLLVTSELALDSGVSDDRRVDVAFAVGLGPDGANRIERHLPAGAAPDVVAAAAMGLGYSKDDATEHVLVELALRPSSPPEAVEALFSFYKMRGPDKLPPATLPDDRLLAYAKHRLGRGRAALGHLGRAVKDPALVEVLGELATSDRDFEVRRAAVMGLGDGPPKKQRPADLRETCLNYLAHALADKDARVVAAACRAVSTYVPPTSLQVQQLLGATNHADFNVRVAALEGLGKFGSKDTPDWVAAETSQLTKLATSDPSTSVRYAAGKALAEVNADAAQKLVDTMLADASEYVRSGGVEVLAKSEDLTAAPHLAQIAKTDPHVRVRETAVGAFEGKKDSQIAKDAVRAALADADVGVASTAVSIAAKNEWKELTEAIAAFIDRFPGCLGADYREAAISALSDLDADAHRALFESRLADDNPAVRAAAEAAVAKLDKKDPPKDPTRGADLTGELLPGGAPIFDAEPFLVIETDQGTMRVRLYPDQAPVHCAHVAALARTGFYDGLTWHRVVPDFVIQGGCPRGDGSGNAGVSLPLEPTRIPFERGTLGMPRSNHPDTGGCQLFICHSRAPHLDVRYTAFGKVVEGFDVIDRIDVDSKIVRVRVEGVR